MARKFSVIAGLALLFAYFFFPDSFQPDSVRGKRVLVTGASTGIGEQVAYEYSKLGASVVIAARRGHLLQKVASKCKELGAQQVEVVVADLSLPEDRSKAVAFVRDKLGGLDHLILNHVAYPETAYFSGSDQNVTDLRKSLDDHFISYVDIASKSLEMLTASKGNIGVVSSAFGKFCVPKCAMYCTNKFALQGFFSALRQEMKLRSTGVSVTICVLGSIATDIVLAMEETQPPRWKFLLPSPAPVTGAAMAIVRGVSSEQNEMYYPKSIRIWSTIYNLFLGLMENLVYHLLVED